MNAHCKIYNQIYEDGYKQFNFPSMLITPNWCGDSPTILLNVTGKCYIKSNYFPQ